MDNGTNGVTLLPVSRAAKAIGRSNSWITKRIQSGEIKAHGYTTNRGQRTALVDLAEIGESASKGRKPSAAQRNRLPRDAPADAQLVGAMEASQLLGKAPSYVYDRIRRGTFICYGMSSTPSGHKVKVVDLNELRRHMSERGHVPAGRVQQATAPSSGHFNEAAWLQTLRGTMLKNGIDAVDFDAVRGEVTITRRKSETITL